MQGIMRINSLIITFLITLFPFSCKSRQEKINTSGTERSTSNIYYAERFTLEKQNDITILTIKDPWQGAKNVNQIFYLVKKGKELPESSKNGTVINVPVERIICMSTTHCAMVSALNEKNSIVAVSGSDYFYESYFTGKVKKGELKEIGYDDNINKELVISLSPDLIMIYGVGSESAGYHNKIRELGFTVMYNADYLEVNPLGKAEWIKLFGALYCKEELAGNIFNKIEQEYNSLRDSVSRNISGRPQVLLGLPWKDIWFVSPGNSYISALIKDGGGHYLWEETQSEISAPYSLENVFLKALNAEYWLNIGSAKTRMDITGIDPRLADLPCFKSGKTFNNNKRTTGAGGNDYWESGSLHPHIILRDIASILHPELFPNTDQVYYKLIE
jgi:iron complex transport system substrate-binding protein